MTKLVRESGTAAEPIQATFQGTVQEITVDTSESVVFCDIGKKPDASSGQRFRISPDFAEYFGITPGHKVAAAGSTTSNVMTNPVGVNTTLVRIFYDKTAGKVEVMEAE